MSNWLVLFVFAGCAADVWTTMLGFHLHGWHERNTLVTPENFALMANWRMTLPLMLVGLDITAIKLGYGWYRKLLIVIALVSGTMAWLVALVNLEVLPPAVGFAVCWSCK